MQNLSDRILGACAILIAALMLWQTSVIQESFIQDPLGPKAFPTVIAIVIGIAGVAILLRPDAEPSWPGFGRIVEIALAAAVMIAYAQLLPMAGFVLATSVAAAYLVWRLETPPLRAMVAGIVISLAIYAVFGRILGLSLAKGPWGF
ncbi:MAG: tripartite tricarboxylate transporter TctB family protein [Hyphomicrobiaceae bacterium]